MQNFKTRFTEIQGAEKKEGTKIKGESMTNQSALEDTEIYTIIEKYACGIIPKTKNEQPMYIDTTVFPTSVNEALEIRGQMEEYFEQMPALARKRFGDNFNSFYEDYRAGNYKKFLEVGALTQAQINERKKEYETQMDGNSQTIYQNNGERNITNNIGSN